MKIILASGSPRRRELIHYITDDFEVCISDADETLPYSIDPYKAAQYLSVKKAEAAAKKY
ncbi:MAG: Maf family protein, partial [Ruminococcus sp.]